MKQPSGIKKTRSDPVVDGMGFGTPDYRCLTSEALFRGQRVLRIVHAGQEYRLHVTRKDKLILTK